MFVEARADVARTIVEVSIDAAIDVVMEETKDAVDGPKSSKKPIELPDEDLEGSRVANSLLQQTHKVCAETKPLRSPLSRRRGREGSD